MVKMALVGWVNPAKFFRETSHTGRHHRVGGKLMALDEADIR
jgi:hypothetical protein